MLNVGVIASSAIASHIGQVAGNNYTGGTSGGVVSTVAPDSAASPVTITSVIGTPTSNTITWAASNLPGAVYTVTQIAPDGTVTSLPATTSNGITAPTNGNLGTYTYSVQTSYAQSGVTTYTNYTQLVTNNTTPGALPTVTATSTSQTTLVSPKGGPNAGQPGVLPQ